MSHKKQIVGITSDVEREFYASKDTTFIGINIKGPQDGESAFKESKNIEVINSNFDLRYPFWHNSNLQVKNSNFSATSRAAFWYDEFVTCETCNGNGVKFFRECKNLILNSCDFESEEIGWRCTDIEINNSKISGFYAFFESKNIKIDNIDFKGKYSFQYTKNVTITNSYLDTKDAFWHAENVVVRNCTIKGEYLAWYANAITFDNCKIIGTQPICYSNNIRFINCEFVDADFSFEYSNVNGSLKGTMISIKNPLSGSIVIEKIPEMIIDENDRSNGRFTIREEINN